MPTAVAPTTDRAGHLGRLVAGGADVGAGGSGFQCNAAGSSANPAGPPRAGVTAGAEKSVNVGAATRNHDGWCQFATIGAGYLGLVTRIASDA